MILTSNYALKKPEGTDVVNINDFNSNADIIDGKLKELETNEIFYAVATGSANTYAVSISALSTLSTYFDGLAVCVKINIASTGASTLNVNGWGAKSIVDSLGNPITSGGLKANTPYTLRYNGVNFILQGKGGGGNVTADKLLIGSTATGDTGQVNGTMPNNGAISITPGTTTQTIPLGYTSGGTVTGDSDLVTGNIKSGVTIFGVAGKSSVVDTSDGTATADKILTGSNGYINGSKVAGSMPNNGAVTITPGSTAKTIPLGYHNGSGTVATDSNLVTGNIKAGVSIFGVTGKSSVVETSDGTATAGQMLSGVSGYVNGAKVTGTIASKGTATITPGTANQTIASGQYISGTQTILGDSELVASNIINTANIFGVQGTAPTIDNRYTRNGFQYWSDSVMPVTPITGGQQSRYYNGKVYVFLSVLVSGNSYKNSMQIYDTNTDTWTAGADLNSTNGLRYMNMDVYNGKIYLTGGNQVYSTGSFNSSIICYDIATNTYSTVTYFPTALYLPVATLYNGKIYVFRGNVGSNNGNSNNNTYIYDIASNTWSTMAVTPSNLGLSQSGAFCGYNGNIYALGGNTAYAYTYNIASNTWATWKAYTTFGDLSTFQVYNGELYLFMTNAVAVKYNISTATWIKFDDLRGCYGGNANWSFGEGNMVYLLDIPKYASTSSVPPRTQMRMYQVF